MTGSPLHCFAQRVPRARSACQRHALAVAPPSTSVGSVDGHQQGSAEERVIAPIKGVDEPEAESEVLGEN